MHTRARTAALSLLLAVVAACGAEQAPQDEADARAEAEARAEARAQGRSTDKTVFDDLIKTEDRARGVEATTMASKAATDAAIEEQSGEGSAEEQQ